MQYECDYLVIGAGSAGCVLANRLSEDPGCRVVLVEAGGSDAHPYVRAPAGFAKLTGTSHSWGYSTVAQEGLGGREVWYPQGKTLGGSSSINAMVYTRGNPTDFDRWADAGAEGWGWQDVLPYFRKLEDNPRFVNELHGQGGPLLVSDQTPHELTAAFVRAAQQAGMPFNPDFNGAQQEGCGFYQVTTRGGLRSSAARCYLRPARKRSNLTVLKRAMATGLILDGTRATGARLVQDGKAVQARAAREVIVAAGTIGSPKLLMLSGIGPADHLREFGIDAACSLPGVGQNLQDHFDLCAICECSGSYSIDKYKPWWMTLYAMLQFGINRTGIIASNLVDGGGFWKADPSAPAPEIQFHFLPGSGLEQGIESVANGVTANSALMRPASRGWVRLASGDSAAKPLINPNYWGEEEDVEKSLAGLQKAREIMRQEAFAPYIKREVMPGPDVTSDSDLRAYGSKHGKTDYHPVGTCKIGSDSDAMAVVDPQLRVRGIDGLRVADASVMPLEISSNTNATTIMIGERAADLIKGSAAG